VKLATYDCHAWLEHYFQVNAEDHPNRDGVRFIRQAAMTKMQLWELYKMLARVQMLQYMLG
jgi:hypothetical protein